MKIAQIPSFQTPSPRCGHDSFIYKNDLYLFGGNTIRAIQNPIYNIRKTTLNKYSFLTNEWSTIETGFPEMEKFTAFSTCVIGDSVYFVSGHTENSTWDHSFMIWSWNFKTEKPAWINVNSVLKGRLPGRYGHSVVPFGKHLVVFGGDGNRRQDGHFLEVLYMHTVTYKVKIVKLDSSRLQARSFHSTVLQDPDIMIVFGGMYHVGFETHHLNEMLSFDLGNQSCRVIQPTSRDVPCPRRSHRCCMGKWNEMFLYGGFSDVLLNDLWKFDFNTHHWTQIDVQGDPTPRRFFSMNFYENSMYLFGGVSNITEHPDFEFYIINEFCKIDLYKNEEAKMKVLVWEALKQGDFTDVMVKTG